MISCYLHRFLNIPRSLDRITILHDTPHHIPLHNSNLVFLISQRFFYIPLHSLFHIGQFDVSTHKHYLSPYTLRHTLLLHILIVSVSHLLIFSLHIHSLFHIGQFDWSLHNIPENMDYLLVHPSHSNEYILYHKG